MHSKELGALDAIARKESHTQGMARHMGLATAHERELKTQTRESWTTETYHETNWWTCYYGRTKRETRDDT